MRLCKIILSAGAVFAAVTATYSADYHTYNPLGQAIKEDNVELVKQMLEAGADPNEMQQNITPLGVAIEWGSQRCIDVLLDNPKININQMYTVYHIGGMPTTRNRNAVLSAVANKNYAAAHKLLDMGCDPDFVSTTRNMKGEFCGDETALTMVYYYDKCEEVVEMAQHIANNTKSIDRVFNYTQYNLADPDVSLLQKLIGEGNEDRTMLNPVTISLMERGADFKRYFEMSSVGNELIEKSLTGAALEAYRSARKYGYSSALLAAARVGNAELMRYMIDGGAQIERYDDGAGVLFSACVNTACIEVLLECGVDINTRYPTGMPLLLSAVTADNIELIDGLLRLGADPFIAVNGITVRETMRTYPSKRKKGLIAIYKKYGYDL